MSAKNVGRVATPAPASQATAPQSLEATRARSERPGASSVAPRPNAPWMLIIEDEEGHRTQVALGRDAYSLGRDPACDVTLAQHNVSRRHALLAREGEGEWALRDLGSRYGSFVNGKRVEGSCPLTHRDMAQVGDFLLTLTSEAQRAAPDERALDLPPKEANDPLNDRPDRVRVFGSLVSPSREVRLDRGPVFVGADADCTVRTPPLAFAPRLQLRPLISRYGDRDTSLDGGRRPPVGPRYEILDESATPCLLVNSRPLKSKVLDDDDIVELADHREVDEDYAFRAQRTFALRYLRRGRSSWTHATPPPLHDTWTPPNLPINLPQERFEHGWANVSGPPDDLSSVDIEIDIVPARREAPTKPPPALAPEDNLPLGYDDTLPPEAAPDTVPGGAPSARRGAAPLSGRAAPAAPLSGRAAPASPRRGPSLAASASGLTTGEIKRLLLTIEPDEDAPTLTLTPADAAALTSATAAAWPATAAKAAPAVARSASKPAPAASLDAALIAAFAPTPAAPSVHDTLTSRSATDAASSRSVHDTLSSRSATDAASSRSVHDTLSSPTPPMAPEVPPPRAVSDTLTSRLETDAPASRSVHDTLTSRSSDEAPASQSDASMLVSRAASEAPVPRAAPEPPEARAALATPALGVRSVFEVPPSRRDALAASKRVADAPPPSRHAGDAFGTPSKNAADAPAPKSSVDTPSTPSRRPGDTSPPPPTWRPGDTSPPPASWLPGDVVTGGSVLVPGAPQLPTLGLPELIAPLLASPTSTEPEPPTARGGASEAPPASHEAARAAPPAPREAARAAPTSVREPSRAVPTSVREPSRAAPAPAPEPPRAAPAPVREPSRAAPAPTPEPSRAAPAPAPIREAPAPAREASRTAPAPAREAPAASPTSRHPSRALAAPQGAPSSAPVAASNGVGAAPREANARATNTASRPPTAAETRSGWLADVRITNVENATNEPAAFEDDALASEVELEAPRAKATTAPAAAPAVSAASAPAAASTASPVSAASAISAASAVSTSAVASAAAPAPARDDGPRVAPARPEAHEPPPRRSHSVSLLLLLGGAALGIGIAVLARWGSPTTTPIVATPTPQAAPSTVAALATSSATTPTAMPNAPAPNAPVAATPPPAATVATPTPPAANIATPTPPAANIATPPPPAANIATPPPPAANIATPIPPAATTVTPPTKVRGGKARPPTNAPRPEEKARPAAKPPAGDDSDSELQRHLRCQKLGTCNEP